ncbi:sensor histidine kinase [Hymenobacter edaphi]|uniref:histidine kinase n=1 Tax=Hymenobacter edaphi TaxID=2211146 RepID=A0A328BWV5_9BACT|nr:ATP-binding protein [Hymenobacter edaphi]RAK70344.1 ATP-binding protein [Hymenobacter edaphi]
MRSDFRFRLAATVLLLAAALGAAAGLLLLGRPGGAALALLPALWAAADLYRGQARLQQELQDFTAAVRYGDFSRQYGRRSGRPELQALHAGFQEINAAFRRLSREKETQYQHLQSILELIQTGILSYEPATGAVWWLNGALKEMLRLPHLKHFSGLVRRYPALAAQLAELRPGPAQVATVAVGSGVLRLLVAASVFQTEGRQYKLVALHSVGDTLDETEADAWQKLLRVLTHEIMNSVAPIASLAATLQQRLHAADPADPDLREDLELGIETIKRRSDGLLQFSTTYRSLSKISAPNRQPLPVYELFETVHHLLLPRLQERGIGLDVVLPDPQLRLLADRVLLEQVLINLVINAIDALAGRAAPRITLTGAAEPGRTVLSVADNGAGMDAETQEQVFVPFFTTKKNGSGIGLSLCKQIMLLHKGSIQLRSAPDVGTVITLTLSAGEPG